MPPPDQLIGEQQDKLGRRPGGEGRELQAQGPVLWSPKGAKARPCGQSSAG